MKNNFLSKIVYYLLIIVFMGGLIGSIFLPNLYNQFSPTLFKEQPTIYKITFYICYFLSLFIIGLVINIFKIIQNETPFQKKIGQMIKLISLGFMILALIILLKFIFIPTLLTLAIAFICFIVSLCFYSLADVFNVAIAYKNEIDYTI